MATSLQEWKVSNNYRKSENLLSCYNCSYRNENGSCMLANMQCYDPLYHTRTDFYIDNDCTCDKHFGDIFNETFSQKLQEAGLYDSVQETLEHKRLVERFLELMITLIKARAETHDESKLLEPERSIFTLFSRKLINNKYGDNDYETNKKLMEKALKHHYDRNSHHPEHYPNGINGMDLIDLMEMLCDWKAAGMRHKDGDIMYSIEKCSERFHIEPQLKEILINTAARYLNNYLPQK